MLRVQFLLVFSTKNMPKLISSTAGFTEGTYIQPKPDGYGVGCACGGAGSGIHHIDETNYTTPELCYGPLLAGHDSRD